MAVAGLDASSPTEPDSGFATLHLRARAVSDAGVVELAADGSTEIAVDSRFELELGALKDVRVRLFDESDKVVPSTDRLELGQASTYQLVPNEALTPGSGYALLVDGLRAPEPQDISGKLLQPARIALRTAGEKPARSAAPGDQASGKTKKKPKRGRY